ncbi:hypothetical protein AWC23_16180 [Mycobacterium saskatchewanense]|uniref:Uncharacterized protein n=1 Tax=Mycobacterium saskatchewanense TaxID=220927 RepID=A0AAJ3NPN7_9MYCO|nr:hypothetical protein AWC23_16180 [Mycobacterium saskatchewanense]
MIAGEVDDDAAAAHAAHGICGDQGRRGAPGHESGRDDDVVTRNRLGQTTLLLGLFRRCQSPRVPAFTGRRDTEFEPLGA